MSGGRILAGFWPDFGRILAGFWQGFGRVFGTEAAECKISCHVRDPPGVFVVVLSWFCHGIWPPVDFLWQTPPVSATEMPQFCHIFRSAGTKRVVFSLKLLFGFVMS